MIYNSGEDKLLEFAYNLKLIAIVLCEGTPSFRAVVESLWPVLVFYVPFQRVQRCASCGSRVVAGRP